MVRPKGFADRRRRPVLANFTLGAMAVAGALAASPALAQDAQQQASDARIGGIVVKPIDLDANPVSAVPSDCFWVAAVTSRQQSLNILLPDAGATYWMTQLKLPAGSRLELNGKYPHARYISFTAYNSEGSPVGGINDQSIQPENGSINPFLEGANRNARSRSYKISILDQLAPSNGSVPSNTIFGRSDESVIQVYYRVYVNDIGTDITGNVGLPRPVLTLSDGRRLRGKALCRKIVIREGVLRDRVVPRERYLSILESRKNVAPAFPAFNPPDWESVQNSPLLLTRLTKAGTPEGDRERQNQDQVRRGGLYPPLDNRYMISYIDRRYGPVLTLRGTMPTFSQTMHGTPVMRHGQLRYWSLCYYHSLAYTAGGPCLFDEQVTLDEKRQFTIVVSRKEDRPANARKEYGVSWLEWDPRGDGIENKDGGFIAVRNMLPDPNFAENLSRVTRIGQEQSILKQYYPIATYSSKQDFEAGGCE